MAADTIKKIYEAQPGTTDTLLYTAPAAGPTIIRSIHICNTTGTAATITLGLNTGAAIVAAEHFFSALSVPANGTVDWDGWQVVDASETIRALQGTASALTLTIAGVETS